MHQVLRSIAKVEFQVSIFSFLFIKPACQHFSPSPRPMFMCSIHFLSVFLFKTFSRVFDSCIPHKDIGMTLYSIPVQYNKLYKNNKTNVKNAFFGNDDFLMTSL